MSTASLWNDMLDVECGSLQRLVHAAMFTTARGSVLDTERDVSPDIIAVYGQAIGVPWLAPAPASH